MTVPVGRTPQIEAITAQLDAAGGRSSALIIEGDAGIGKTTLWLDGVRHARERGLRVLTARAGAAESVLAYAALADLLAEVEHELWADLPAPQRQGLAAALLSDYEATAPTVDQRAVGAAFLVVLKRLATESPLVVAIDDLQWLDASSAAAIAFAARRVSDRVQWLCTARTDETSASTAWLHVGQPGDIRRISLPPLPISALHDVLATQLGAPIARPTMLRIHEMSGGNPFYAIELAREVGQRGPGAEVGLPDSLAGVTRARIDRVGRQAADALLAIASLANPTVRVVADATGVTPQRLVHQLEEAEAQGIIAIEGNRMRFTHPLLAHAVHSGATSSRRRSMHRHLSEVVVEPELRARHLALADPAGEPETLAALDAAADIARDRAAPAAAAELLDLAVGLGGGTARRRMRLAECLFDAGEPRRARGALEAAIGDMPPGPERAEALQQLALVRVYDDSFHEAVVLGVQASDECAVESAQRVGILTVLAFARLNTGLVEEALTTAEQAVAIAERLQLAEPLSRALGMRAIMQFMNGDDFDASDLRRAAALEDPNVPVPVAFRPTVQSALISGWTGDMVGARETLTQVARRCAELGEEGELMFVAFQLGVLHIWLGELNSAADIADDAVQRADQLGGDSARFIALTVRGAVAAYRGRVDDARRDLADAAAAGADSGHVLMMTWTVAVRAFLALSLGDHAGALSAVEPLLPMVELMPRSTEILGASFVPDAAEALINLSRLDEAEVLVQMLERNGARLDRAWMLAVGARCRAMLSAARGDVTTAVAHGHEALAHHDRVAMPFERARTLLVLGRLERRLRHWRSAKEMLTEALTVFEDLGTPLWAAQVRVELDRGTAGRRRSPGLTPTERRVAELAAKGMTNQDIASALCVARKTVEVNLSRVYHKLGIHSRIELYRVMGNTTSA